MRATTRAPRREGFVADERGAVSVEYVVVLLLVALVGLAAWQSYQQTIEDDANAQYRTFGYPG